MRYLTVCVLIFGCVQSINAQPNPAKTLKANAYPLDQELGGGFGGSGNGIALKCKVTKNKGMYIYTYTAKNVSKKQNCMFSWGVLDRAIGSGWTIAYWWDLQPEEEIKIVLRHKEAPVWFNAPAKMMSLSNPADKGWEGAFQGVTMPARNFFHVGSFGQPGPLPPSFIKDD